MIKRIANNLRRQKAGMSLMKTLVEQEKKFLSSGRAHLVGSLEISIQELIRQLASEKEEARNLVRLIDPEAKSVSWLVSKLPADAAKPFISLIREIDKLEQHCSRVAAVNSRIAKALMDQSEVMLGFFQEKVTPRVQNTYSSYGRWRSITPKASLFEGRL